MSEFENECVRNLKENGFRVVSRNPYGDLRLEVIGTNIEYDYYLSCSGLWILQKREDGEPGRYASVSDAFWKFMKGEF